MSAWTLMTDPSVRLPMHDTALPVSVHTGASRMPSFFSSSTSVAANFTPVMASPPTGASPASWDVQPASAPIASAAAATAGRGRRVMRMATPPPMP